MGKKLNRTEIATLAKRILEEVNEVNKKYNETIEASQAYKDEVARIEAKYPLHKITQQFEKELKIAFGTDYEDKVNFSLSTQYRGELRDKEKEVQEELDSYYKSVLKTIYIRYNTDYQKKIDKIVDDITIAQIDITDVQMLINTIKAKLI